LALPGRTAATFAGGLFFASTQFVHLKGLSLRWQGAAKRILFAQQILFEFSFFALEFGGLSVLIVDCALWDHQFFSVLVFVFFQLVSKH